MLKNITQFQPDTDLLKHLVNIEKFQGVWEFTSFNQPTQLIKQLKHTTIITSSGASTRIEGAILSDEEVEQLINSGCIITKVSSRSEREVAGYVKALNFIYDHYSTLPVTELTIRELHQLLTSELAEKHLPKKQRGVYKDITNHVVERNAETGEEKIWFQTTPAGSQTDSAMQILVSDFNELDTQNNINKLILIAGFIVHFLAIHPFRDGNGRLSRLITTWLLLRSGYQWSQYSSHEKIIEDNKERYYVALRKTQKSFSHSKYQYNHWINLFFLTLEKQIQFVEKQICHESFKTALNDNEMRVYDLINESGICTTAFIRQHIDMTDNGLKSLLQRLVQRNIIDAIGKNRGRKYQIKQQ
ncbi:MAG: Fic family protein [Methylococcales bacterium]|jgi:Fic family protein|nr:Fic family protein [Methylococcales bacterium]